VCKISWSHLRTPHNTYPHSLAPILTHSHTHTSHLPAYTHSHPPAYTHSHPHTRSHTHTHVHMFTRSHLHTHVHTLCTQLEGHSRPIRTAAIATLKPSTPQKILPTSPQSALTPATQTPPPSTNAKPSPVRNSHNQATPTSRKMTPTKTTALKATPHPLVEQQSQMVQPTEKPTLKPTMKPKLKLKKVGGARQTKHGKGEGGKKGTNKSITIPSIEYPVSWSSMLQHGGYYSRGAAIAWGLLQ